MQVRIKVRQHNVAELRTWLKQHGFPTDGKKDVLCNRVWTTFQEQLTKPSKIEVKTTTSSSADVGKTTDKDFADVSKNPQPLSDTSEPLSKASAIPTANLLEEPIAERPVIDIQSASSKTVSPPTGSTSHQNSTLSLKVKDNPVLVPPKVSPARTQAANASTSAKPTPVQAPQVTPEQASVRATSSVNPNEQPRPSTPTTSEPNHHTKNISIAIVSGIVGWLAYPSLKGWIISQD
ncbi:hypothetical protein IWQ62_004799 [Dispira parvispora]|uniref:SAP domain-containing protein n=1 Tax=Dispira parvispora TaxID=1520584 RepID=A0A9W8E0A0_9FUNG|nr:hypothetical protein IWQ62_004799 [Dispira parvispora]